MLEQARGAYARFQWDSAYHHYRDAATQQPLGPEDLAALADAAWWLGRTDESLNLSEEVYRHHLHGAHVPQAARLAIEIAFLWLLRGEETIGSGWLNRAARLLEETPECAAHGYLRYLEVEVALGAGRFDEAIKLSRWILGLADRHGDPTLRAVALVLEGGADVRRGRVDAGLAVIDEAMLPVRAGEVAPSWAGNLYCHVMDLFFELSDIRRARAWTEATERWCDEHSNAAMFRGICRIHRAELLQLEGAWEAAEQRAAQACRELADMNVGVVAAGHYRIAELHRLRGDHAAAEEAYARAHALGRDPQPGLALLRLAEGHTEAAASALRSALAATPRPLDRVPLLSAVVEVAAAARAGDEAAQAAGEIGEIAETFNTPGLLASARQASGLAHLAAGEPAAALPILREACGRWQELDARYAAARLRVHLADALVASGDRDTAAREAGAARAALTELGAGGDLRALDGVRAAAGPAPAPANGRAPAAVRPPSRVPQAAETIAFGVLGPLEVRCDDEPLPVRSAMQRRLLALLLVHGGESVRADRVIDVLWEGAPTPSARTGLHAYVSRLRRRLGGGAAIESDGHGYRLHLHPQAVDAWRFERAVAAARAQLDEAPAQAAEQLAEALALWRGSAYAEFADEEFARPEAVRLDELRLAATEDAFAARLACGETSVVADLEAMVAAHPLRERLHGQLMTALARSGRTPDALEVFQRLRSKLDDELGLEPSPALQQLQADILNQRSDLAPPVITASPRRGDRPARVRGAWGRG